MNIIRYQNPELAAWSPYDRLTSLRDLLDSAFQLASSGRASGWAPPLDLFEDEDKVTAKIEVAGAKKENFDISLQDGVLTVSGERKSETKEGDGESFRSERVFGSFSRSVTLPAAVKTGEVTASYEDGVLTVVLPKAEEAKPKKIQVSLN